MLNLEDICKLGETEKKLALISLFGNKFYYKHRELRENDLDNYADKYIKTWHRYYRRYK